MSEITGQQGTTGTTTQANAGEHKAALNAAAETDTIAASDVILTATTDASAPVLVLQKPVAGHIEEVTWDPGQAIVANFKIDQATITVGTGFTTFTWADGASLKVFGLELGEAGMPVLTQATTASADVLVLDKPLAGHVEEVTWVRGEPIVANFNIDQATITVVDGATIFSWADGSVLRVVGLELGASGIPESPVTLGDGTVVGLDDFAGLAGITPAAGDAGAAPAGGAAGPGNQGHAATDPNPGDIGLGLNDTGALPYTELFFSVPELTGDTDLLEEEAELPQIVVSVDSVTVTEGDPIEGAVGNDGGEFQIAVDGLIDDPATSITFHVTLNAPSDTEVTVHYNVIQGTALEGIPLPNGGGPEGDYNGNEFGFDPPGDPELSPLSGDIIFPPGVTELTITLNIVDDDIFEVTESFTVELSDPVGAVIGSNPGTGTILDDDAVASLGINKEVGGEQGADVAGEVITYTIQVFNAGNQTLTGVTVTDPNADAGITRNADLSGDNDADLEVGETWSFTASHTVTQAELDDNGGGDGDLDNIATATSDQTGPVSDDASVPVFQNPSLNIVKNVESVEGGSADVAGDLITYTITVANQGNTTLTNVVVSDPNADAPPVRGADISGDGDNLLEVGEIWSYTATHTVTQAELDEGGSIVNVATADSNETPPDTDDSSVPLVQNPALDIQKVADGEQIANVAGEAITYTITVANTGNQTLTGVVVTDPNANTIALVADAASADGELDVGETWTYTATHIVTQGELDSFGGGDGDLDNIATADSTQSGPDSDDATVPVGADSSLDIVKTAVAGQTADTAGEKLTYNITVANTGNQTLTGVTVTDPNADAGITRNVDIVGDNDTNLEVGETWSFTATHTVTQAELDSNGGGDGDVDNIATADSTQSPPDSDDASVPLVQSPSLNIVKDVEAVEGGANGTADSAGDVITYTITVANTGNTTLTGVVVTDPNANSIALVANAASADGELDVGETWNYTATHIVTQAEIDNNGGGDGDIDNLATADSTQTGPDSDDASVPVVQISSLDIVKDAVAGQTADVAGEKLTYAITVANTGNQTLTGVTVTDPNADAGITRNVDLVGDNDANLEVGETWSFTATHTLTQAELDNNGGGDGDIDNLATADSNQTGPDSDDASVPLVQNKSLNIVKDVESVEGGVNNATADSVGDVISYTITVANTGNAAISNVVVADPFADNAPVRGLDLVGDDDAVLEVGETWSYTASHTVSQADFDAAGTTFTNIATATGTGVPTDSDDSSVPLNGSPINGTANAAVFERGNEATAAFAAGTVPGSNDENALNIPSNLSFGPDGPASAAARFDWNTSVGAVDSDNGNAPVVLTSGGAPVSWVLAGGSNGETLNAVIQSGPNAGQIVATLTANFSGSGAATQVSFDYQQFGPFDHPDNSITNPPNGESQANDPIRLTFNYTIQDSSGTTNNLGTFNVTVNDDAPTGTVVKADAVDSGATGHNLAFVVDVSNSTTQDTDLVTPGVQSRLSVEITALKTLLQQAVDNDVVGPVLIVAFHGILVSDPPGNNNAVVNPATAFETFASAADALAAVDAFFASLGGPPFPADGLPDPGSTRWEGGLDVAAKWFAGSLVNETDGGAVTQPNDVEGADNRLFFLTDGANNNSDGGFDPHGGAGDPEVDRLYTNVDTLANDIPNLTVRTVAILNGDTDSDGTPDAVEFAGIVDQSDDNLINGSATIVNDTAGAAGIVAGFGLIVGDTTSTGNLLLDDDVIAGVQGGEDGVTPVIGADGLDGLASFTFLNESGIEQTVTSGGTFTTFLGGTITVVFADDSTDGNYTYTAPTGDVTGTETFTYQILDGDNDVLPGVLTISVGAVGTTADNAGFETDTLQFWSAAGSVWVSDDANYTAADTEGSFFAVLHTGNTGSNTELTPDADRTAYSDTTLEGFMLPDQGAVDLDTLVAAVNAIDGAVLTGTFDTNTAGGAVQSFDVSFDWQFVSDQDINPGGQNDIAFVVIEGQLIMLANSDNAGTEVASVLAAQNITVDGQIFTNATAYQNDTTFTVADANNDGLINVTFGVINGDAAAGIVVGSSSALVVDDVRVTPDV